MKDRDETSPMPRVVSRLVAFWWWHLPALAGRLSRTLSRALVDGIYLTGWPRAAAFGPALALLLGVIAGCHGLGASQVFSQSALILSLAVLLGFASTQLGALYVLGYAAADFLLRDHPELGGAGIVAGAKLRIAMLITYAALAIMAVAIPLFSRLVTLPGVLRGVPTTGRGLTATAVLSGVFGVLFLFVYLHAVPVLIRPLFVWRHGVPPEDAVWWLQKGGVLFAVLALVASLSRFVLERRAPFRAQTLELLELSRSSDSGAGGILDRLSERARLMVAIAATGVLLSGLYDSWLSSLAALATLVGLGIARRRLSARGGGWPRAMQKIPVLLRLLAVLTVTSLLAWPLRAAAGSTQSFQPLLWTLLLSLALAMAAFPSPSEPPGEANPRE